MPNLNYSDDDSEEESEAELSEAPPQTPVAPEVLPSEGSGEGDAEEAAEQAAEAEAEAEATAAKPSNRPRGRAPKGKSWDTSQGSWVAAGANELQLKERRARAQPERLNAQTLIAPAHYRQRTTETREEDTAVRKGKVKAGMRVMAQFGVDDDEAWFPGVVATVHADGRIDVQYDDGDTEERKDPTRVTELVTEAEGLRLHLSNQSATGYRGVLLVAGGFKAQVHENETTRHLGSFATAVEAAICYARHIQVRRPATDEGGSDAKRAKSVSPLETAAFYAKHVLEQSAAAPAAASSALASGSLPPGWTVEERVTLSGRQYQVYHSGDGKHTGVRSRKAAWEAHTSLQEDATGTASDPSPPPSLTGMAEVRALLASTSLDMHAEALEELGYDDLQYLQSLDRETLMSIAAEAGIVKPGHVARFSYCVLGRT